MSNILDESNKISILRALKNESNIYIQCACTRTINNLKVILRDRSDVFSSIYFLVMLVQHFPDFCDLNSDIIHAIPPIVNSRSMAHMSAQHSVVIFVEIF